MSVRVHGSERGSGPAVVLLHGFTGCAAAWDGLAERLAARHRVLAFDLPGHGAAPAPARPDDCGLTRVAAALAARVGAVGVSDAVWVGYSLGGRVALHVALDHPARVRGLVLEGASPGIADPAERRARAAADAALADAIERDGLERFVDAWLAQPLFASQARLPAAVREHERARRLRGSAAGYAAALRALSVGVQASLWSRLGEIRAPVLLLAGEEDVKYCGLARAMADAIRDARLALIGGAGHTAHLEQPRAWLAAVEPFLARAAGLRGAGAA